MKFFYKRFDMDEVVQFAIETLKDRSPVGSKGDSHPGLYRDSHFIFLEGQNVPDVKSWTPGERIEITNPVPYSRKIEIGKFKVNVASHVYEGAVPIINAKYGKQVICTFALLPARLGPASALSQSPGARALARRIKPDKNQSHNVEWLVRQPTLLIKSR